jgi:hypothetical protein
MIERRLYGLADRQEKTPPEAAHEIPQSAGPPKEKGPLLKEAGHFQKVLPFIVFASPY